MKRASRRLWLTAACAPLLAALAAPLTALLTPAARAAAVAPPVVRAAAARAPAVTVAPVKHVVIVGVSGLRWDEVSPAATPELWRLATAGSAGALIDYAQQPLACPADGWLTLNAAARAQGPRRPGPHPCGPLPEVIRAGAGARVPALPGLIAANRGFRESPSWGLLGSLAGCATAVGPGAALALASAAGTVASYLPSATELSPVVLARCPLTVVDLGQIDGTERVRLSALDHQLARIAAGLPAGALLLVTAPGGAAGGGPHLETVVVSGPGYAGGLLTAASTRRPGIVTLTDLTPTVAGWLGRQVPAGTVGARIGRAGRGSLAATVRSFIDRDDAEQVWMSAHGWFFLGYGLADLVLFGLPALLCRGGAPERRRLRARCWRAAGAFAVAVPLGTFLANLVPWWGMPHPFLLLCVFSSLWTLVLGALGLAGPWRRDPLGPFGVICLLTLAVLAVDVMTGSHLQLDAPFGLSLLTGGRFYGIGNYALGVYCVATLVAAAWAARALPPLASPLARREGAAGAAWAGVVGVLAVVASGWPGFGAKVGGTVALVPCLLLLVLALAGIRVRWRWAVPVAVSGLALFAVFALVSYLFPAAGVSDMGAFAGNLLHGRGGDVVARKAGANVSTLTVSVFSWLIPVTAAATALALWRPAALRLRTLAMAFEAVPLVRTVSRLTWLVLVIGWFADDSGVIVPAAALPFAVPLVISMAASVSAAAGGASYRGSAFAGPSVAGQPPR